MFQIPLAKCINIKRLENELKNRNEMLGCEEKMSLLKKSHNSVDIKWKSSKFCAIIEYRFLFYETEVYKIKNYTFISSFLK